MKLGDNMTTMEACNTWTNVCPRKCRPPRIGDIPRHGAVDEESPSSSSRELTIPSCEASEFAVPGGTRLSDERQLFAGFANRATGDIESHSLRPREREVQEAKISTTLGSSENKVQVDGDRRWDSRSVAPDKPVLPRREYPVIELFGHSRLRADVEDVGAVKTSRGLRPRYFREPREKAGEAAERVASPSSSLEEESVSRTTEDDRELIAGIKEVRKDSALFLEEAEGLPGLREILKARSPRFVRPRRESSGYASNIGTFDEERRSSCCTEVLQEAFPGRRSSAKRVHSRGQLGRNEETFPEGTMPTTEVHRKLSAAGLDMPNVRDSSDDFRRKASPPRRNNGRQISELSPDGQETIDGKTSGGNEDPTACKSREGVPSLFAGEEKLDRTSRQRVPTMGIVHQCSTPLVSSDELASIVEKPTEIVSRGVGSIEEGMTKIILEDPVENQRFLPKSVKVYQLLSTQSEDRGDGEPRGLRDRRISLHIPKQEEESDSSSSAKKSWRATGNEPKDAGNEAKKENALQVDRDASQAQRKLSSPEETTEKVQGEIAAGVSARPIYPYCPYSPYASPQGSPRNRRRPLRESRRVSIDNRHGALQLNQYKLLDNIGQGSYGIVKLAYNEEDQTHYAMKILSKKKLMKKAGIFGRIAPGRKGTASPLAKVYREIALLKKLDHPNVVKLVEVLDDPDEDNLYLVFELVEKGEILQVPTEKPLDEDTARTNFRDVVMGVEYLHYQRIVHRDIKPSNLLVDSEGRIKIADLGVSAELRASGELLSGAAGTPAFAAPETTTPGAHYSGTLCDVWSMGITLYSLVTGRVPWDGAGSIIGVQAAIRGEALRFPENPQLSPELRDLISRMLAKDPAERMTLAQMKEHPWLTRNGAEPLPSETDNCRLPVTVTDEEVERVVTRVPKLDTLILIKTMLKQHSFQNPFTPKRSGRTSGSEADPGCPQLPPTSQKPLESAERQGRSVKNTKTEQFHRSGRSHSAPDSYDYQSNGRQISVESSLPPVSEATSQELEIVKR